MLRLNLPCGVLSHALASEISELPIGHRSLTAFKHRFSLDTHKRGFEFRLRHVMRATEEKEKNSSRQRKSSSIVLDFSS